MSRPFLILLLFINLVAMVQVYAADAITADSICEGYRVNSQMHAPARNSYSEKILNICARYSKEKVTDKVRPLYNFRPTLAGEHDDEQSCRIFRGGQPAPEASSPEVLKHFRPYHLGFDLMAAKKFFEIDLIFNLRMDSTYLSYEDVFGKDIARLPLSSGEAIFRYQKEVDLLKSIKIEGVYTPTLPEMEHFIGNYVPRRHKGRDSKPYFCRLPKNFKDGVSPHWVNEAEKYESDMETFSAKGMEVPLVSSFEDCRDWVDRFGAKAEGWRNEVLKVSRLADAEFSTIADLILEATRKGRRVLYHCSSGTDRVGRVSLILETRAYHLTRQELRAYRGPLKPMATALPDLDSSKIDLMVLNYLLSQRAGSDPEFEFLFPDLAQPEKSWIGRALEKYEDPGFPVLKRAREVISLLLSK